MPVEVLRTTFDLGREPRGETYRRLLDHGLGPCGSFLLVERDTVIDPSARAALSRLAPWLIRTTERTEWPGTSLVGHTARVSEFRFDAGSATVLKALASGLFDWRQPDLPEDLCLLRGDGSPWLVTIGHERDAYCELTDQEAAELVRAVPNVNLRTRAPSRAPSQGA